jgi:hypothetical protein
MGRYVLITNFGRGETKGGRLIEGTGIGCARAWVDGLGESG